MMPLSKEGLAPLTGLSSLTELHLPMCEVRGAGRAQASRIRAERPVGAAHACRLAWIAHTPLAAAPAALAVAFFRLLCAVQGEGDCLPRGPWLQQLEVLDLSGFRGATRGHPECLLPPALVNATRLRVLSLDWTQLQCRLADWPHVQVRGGRGGASSGLAQSARALCCAVAWHTVY